MESPELHVLVLAGGESTRIRTGGPKALLDLCGRPLLDHLLRAAEGVEAASRTLVLGSLHRAPVEAWLQESGRGGWKTLIQEHALGTGDAARAGLEALPSRGQVLVLCGDTPLLRPETLQRMACERKNLLLTAFLDDPFGYGRIVRNEEGELIGIVEEADADEETAAIEEVNAGVYLLDLAGLKAAVASLRSNNAQGEFYLTDAVLEMLAEQGGVTLCLEDGGEEILGVNTLPDLAEVSFFLRRRILQDHMTAGVVISDPATTYIEDGVEIGSGSRILPFSVIRCGVRIGARCMVGPFAHLRAGTVLADGSEIGNFVEAKNADLGRGAKAKHLTYLGDVSVGALANIGCGTITANFDGRKKHRTEIGERASIGSGTVLVAPVRVGRRAVTGAGSIVTRNHDVPDGVTVLGVPARPFPQPAPSCPD